MQFQDLLLDGAGGYDPIDCYRILLTNAIGTVAGLILNSRIPPRIQMNDIIGSRQEWSAASFVDTTVAELKQQLGDDRVISATWRCPMRPPPLL